MDALLNRSIRSVTLKIRLIFPPHPCARSKSIKDSCPAHISKQDILIEFKLLYVTSTRICYFAMETSAVARYVQVGNGMRRYLIKEIDSRPDFDHIVSYRAAARASILPVSIAQNGGSEPEANALAAALHALPSAIRGTVYYYTGDLR